MSSPDEVFAFFLGDPPSSLDGMMGLVQRMSPAIDAPMRDQFAPTVERAFAGEFEEWADTPRGLAALIVLLDQFPRHIFRGTVRQYDGGERAVRLALQAYENGWEDELSYLERVFLSMPLLHAEDVEMQLRSVVEADKNHAVAPEWTGFMAEIGPSQARKYLEVIQRFGRFPHRNEMFGRESTAEEIEFLETWSDRMGPDVLRERGLV